MESERTRDLARRITILMQQLHKSHEELQGVINDRDQLVAGVIAQAENGDTNFAIQHAYHEFLALRRLYRALCLSTSAAIDKEVQDALNLCHQVYRDKWSDTTKVTEEPHGTEELLPTA